jgi:putative transposase
MKYNPKIHHRRSIRLKDYDYSQPGAYFITTVTHNNEELFGEIRDGKMYLSAAGKILLHVWLDLPLHYPNVCLDAYCIMPDHVHAIIQFQPVGRGEKAVPLSEIVRALKTFSSKRINILRKRTGQPVWQRNYYEHIIRDNGEWERIREYITNNPLEWEGADLMGRRDYLPEWG